MIHIKTAYMPHKEHRLLHQLYTLSNEATRYALYFNKFKSVKFSGRNNIHVTWFIDTINSYYDQFIGHWCKLFGAYKEPTHYYKLVNFSDYLDKLLTQIGISDLTNIGLKQFLLSNANIGEIEFDIYWKDTVKKYRNKHLIHREHAPEKINNNEIAYPRTEIALSTILDLLIIIQKLLCLFPENQDEINFYPVDYIMEFNNIKSIKEIIESGIPDPYEFIKSTTRIQFDYSK